MSIVSFRISIRGPLAEYGITVSSVASSSLTEIERPPMSVSLVEDSKTSMSQALCFLLAFRSISSPSMLCRLIEPSGFSVEFSVSLKVACSLSPGIASTSRADLRLGEEAGAITGVDRASAIAESSSASNESAEGSGSAQPISSSSLLSPGMLNASKESSKEGGSSSESPSPGGTGGGWSGSEVGGRAPKPGGGEGASSGSSSDSSEISLSSISIKPDEGGGDDASSESSSSSSSKPGGGGGGGGRGNPGGMGGGSSDMARTPRWVATDVAWIGITITCPPHSQYRASRMVEILSPSGESVSSQDGTAPPVLFVVGTAGAGKSSLVTAFQRWGRFLEVDVLAINLDPGAEKVDYDTEFDVRDLVSLSDVMVEYELGPNGAQILAADLVASRADEVFDEIEGLSCDMLIVDTPGQVELFAFREASNHLVNVIGQGRACLIFLFDPMLSQTPSGFVSQMLLSAIVHFRLGLPTANFLSKSDLLEPEALERVMDWGDNLDILEAALFEESAQQALDTESGSQRAEFAIGQLRMMQHASIQPGLIPLSSEYEEGLADVLTFAQTIFGGMADSRDGFAGDIEHERQ